jgi:hypothetical protein
LIRDLDVLLRRDLGEHRLEHRRDVAALLPPARQRQVDDLALPQVILIQPQFRTRRRRPQPQ